MASKNPIKKILIVDDDPGHVKLLDSVLTANGYETLTAIEAADGLQVAMDNEIDLIILDVMMPIINGYNFCQLLKQEQKQRNIYVILVTSRDEKDDIEIGLKMGADAYLTKPINMDELLKTIKAVDTGEST